MKIRKKLSEEGFTILEVMVGLIIFSLGLLLLMSMMVVSIQGNSWSENATQSAQLAREKIEQIKNDPATYLGSGRDVIGDYVRSWDVSWVTADLSAVTVRVAWTDANNRDYACSTMTYIQP
jgi:type II secretory pathway pseudopilin PulG